MPSAHVLDTTKRLVEGRALVATCKVLDVLRTQAHGRITQVGSSADPSAIQLFELTNFKDGIMTRLRLGFSQRL